MEKSAVEPSIIFEKKVRSKLFVFTACHRIPSRSISINGTPIICYRCGGINLGFVFAIILQFVLMFGISSSVDILFGLEGVLTLHSIFIRFIIGIVLQLPFILDGGIQALIKRYESKNPIRLLTGLIGGFGQFYFVFAMGRFVKFLMT